MTDADHSEDLTGPYAGATPQADAWREAREWVDDLFRVVDDLTHLARTGVTRAFGRRLGLFVFSIEAAIRRLVLTLALQLQLPPAGKPSGKPAQPPTPAAELTGDSTRPKPRRVIFRLFAMRGGGRPSVATVPGAIHRFGPVMAIACDPLLVLGHPRPRTDARKVQHSGADWRTLEDPAQALHRRLFGRPERESSIFDRPPCQIGDRRAAPRKPPMLRQDRPVLAPRGLRHDLLIPAPGLARRIAALSNVMLDPMAFATRAARRLARLSHMIDDLRGQPEPTPPTFKDDKRPPPALNLLQRSHALFARPHDTS